nr:hypothetical protein [uncultured Agathobaculum sp.]
MLKFSDLKVDAERTVGSPLVLCGAQPTVAYEEGLPTSRRDGTRYVVACPAAGMQKLMVKVTGEQTVFFEKKGIILVDFDGLEIYTYFHDGKTFIAGRAKAIRRVDGQQ